MPLVRISDLARKRYLTHSSFYRSQSSPSFGKGATEASERYSYSLQLCQLVPILLLF